ncbi:MAG: helix-turn-helix transcriptional regulator [Cyanophyceae cyanobacterium]
MNKFATADNLKIKDQILHLLKIKGPQTATAMAEYLQISPMAVRQHLQALKSEQLITYEQERQPVGRPVKLWQLTQKGNQLFPNAHADLVVKLLEGVREVYGEDGLETVLSQRFRSIVDAYSARLSEEKSWQERVAELAQIRSEEGYMAEVIEQPDHALLLIENHCSICTAAQKCPRLCSSEWEVFQKLLGAEVSVERVEHLLAGDRRCAYLISSVQ